MAFHDGLQYRSLGIEAGRSELDAAIFLADRNGLAVRRIDREDR